MNRLSKQVCLAASVGAIIAGLTSCGIEEEGTPRTRALEANPVPMQTTGIPLRTQMEYSSALVDMGYVGIPANYDY
jgi:hypothetical protein